jgi:hypothetical protein
MEEGGVHGEAPREEGRPRVALDGNQADIAGGAGGGVDEVELKTEVALRKKTIIGIYSN